MLFENIIRNTNRQSLLSAVSRLTWTDVQIVRSVVHKVRQSCTIKQMSMERGFAESMIVE